MHGHRLQARWSYELCRPRSRFYLAIIRYGDVVDAPADQDHEAEGVRPVAPAHHETALSYINAFNIFYTNSGKAGSAGRVGWDGYDSSYPTSGF